MSAEVEYQSATSTIHTPEEARAFFDEAIPEMLGISADEFLRRYDAGDYSDVPDTPENWPIMRAVFLIPFGRQDS